jgi:hypothetical protein
MAIAASEDLTQVCVKHNRTYSGEKPAALRRINSKATKRTGYTELLLVRNYRRRRVVLVE